MKILIIRTYPSFISVKNNTYNIQEVGLAKALIRAGHDCDILFWTNKDEKKICIQVQNNKMITVFYRKGFTALKNTVFRRCKTLFKQYDILQPCEYNQIQSWILSKKYPQKVIIYHGPYYSTFNKKYNAMCKFFDAIFLQRYIKLDTKFITKSIMATNFLENKGIKIENIQTIGVGIDIEMLQTSEQINNEPLYLKMCSDNSKIKLLYVGRLEPRRNIHFIFDVFSLVHKYIADSKLYVIGTGEKDYVENVFNHARDLDIQDNIVWQENMEQKYLSNIYSMSDFFILPTEYEIFGMVLLEAMYYHNVVLTTLNGGSSTLINDDSGVILEELNPELWAKNIVELFENSNKMKDIQNIAAKRIKDEFTWDSLIEKIIYQYNLMKK